MTPKRLTEIQNLGKENQASLAEVVEVITDSFLSQSKHNKDIKTLLTEVLNKLEKIEDRLDNIERQTISHVYNCILEQDTEVEAEENEE